MANANLFNLAMSSTVNVGAYRIGVASTTIMEIDPRFQRSGNSVTEKAKRLANNWDDNKCDPILCSIHRETCTLSIIDGSHRYLAAKLRGIDVLPVRYVEFAEDRLYNEARLFATQADEVDNLSAIERHNANVICNVMENVIVEEVCRDYKVTINPYLHRGKAKGDNVGVLTGFTRALGIAKFGREYLDRIISVICNARWNLSAKGFANFWLASFFNLYKLHPEVKDKIHDALVNIIKPCTPSELYANAYSAYPKRTEVERLTMHLEDKLCDALGISKVYAGGPVTKFRIVA